MERLHRRPGTDEQRKEEAQEERLGGERLERQRSVEQDLSPKHDERRPTMASPRAPEDPQHNDGIVKSGPKKS